MYQVDNSTLTLGGRFGPYIQQQHMVIASDYYLHKDSDVNQEAQYVVLTFDPRRGYVPYTVWIVEEIDPSLQRGRHPLSSSLLTSWNVHYEMSFKTLDCAVNGMSDTVNRYDKMYGQAMPWIAGYLDCLHRYTP